MSFNFIQPGYLDSPTLATWTTDLIEHGWGNFTDAFSSVDNHKKYTFKTNYCDKIKLAVSGILLMIPIINLIALAIFYAIDQYANSKAAKLPPNLPVAKSNDPELQEFKIDFNRLFITSTPACSLPPILETLGTIHECDESEPDQDQQISNPQPSTVIAIAEEPVPAEPVCVQPKPANASLALSTPAYTTISSACTSSLINPAALPSSAHPRDVVIALKKSAAIPSLGNVIGALGVSLAMKYIQPNSPKPQSQPATSGGSGGEPAREPLQGWSFEPFAPIDIAQMRNDMDRRFATAPDFAAMRRQCDENMARVCAEADAHQKRFPLGTWPTKAEVNQNT